jgi:bisphosphoglycerate-independent phosphoglycerate mutase (AlkP superfamily)
MKLEIGSKVRVVNYGHIENIFDEVEVIGRDTNPSIIGLEGVVESYDIHTRTYAVSGIPGKYYPYNRDQLQLI